MMVLIAAEGDAGGIECLLAAEGYHTGRYNPDCGFLPCESGQAGVLVLDSGINAHRGLMQLKQFKSGCPDVPVIFLTELNTVDVVLSAFRAGARDYFPMPLDKAGFLESVCALIRCRKAEREVPLRASEPQAAYGVYGNVPGLVPASIQRALNSVKNKFAGELSLEALSAEAGVSKHHFCRTFKKYTGLSPMNYLTRVRIERAKELLQNTPASISMVAAEVGFNDLSSFIKHFKKTIGCTPRSFKKAAGAGASGKATERPETFQNLRLF